MVTWPGSLVGHSLCVLVTSVVDVLLVVIVGSRGEVTVGVGSDEVEVAFQPHGIEVVLKANNDVVGNKEVSIVSMEEPWVLTPGWITTTLVVLLIGDVVGNVSVGLLIVVMVPKLNNVHQVSVSTSDGLESPPEVTTTIGACWEETIVVPDETISTGP